MELRRIGIGFGSGVVASVTMSVPVFLSILVEAEVMSEPLPLVVAGSLLGEGVSETLVIVVAVAFHLVYGGAWGAVLSALFNRIKIQHGVGLGAVLWVIMMVVVPPMLGEDYSIGLSTSLFYAGLLFLHLVYGAVLGWLLERSLP